MIPLFTAKAWAYQAETCTPEREAINLMLQMLPGIQLAAKRLFCLFGISNYESGNYTGAINYYDKALAVIPHYTVGGHSGDHKKSCDTEVIELGFRDILAVAAWVVTGVVIWIVVLKGGAA